jgi:hypothetical protein
MHVEFAILFALLCLCPTDPSRVVVVQESDMPSYNAFNDGVYAERNGDISSAIKFYEVKNVNIFIYILISDVIIDCTDT